MIPHRLMAGLVAGLVLCGAAQAQDAKSLAANLIGVGQWELATAGRDKTCVVTMKGDQAALGMKLSFEKGCGEALPFTRDIAAWTVRGLDIVRFQDAKGEAVLDVTEVESGIYEGVRSGEGVFLLQNLADARALAKSSDQMIGDWSMVRGNDTTICGLTLTNTETAVPGNFQVFLKPKCDPAVANFAPTMWRIERGEILLIANSGDSWHFAADDNAQWRRVPDSADPLFLVRQ